MAENHDITAIFILFFFLCLVQLSPAATAVNIKHLNITGDSRPKILLDKFVFTHHGRITIGVSSVLIGASSLSRPDPSHFGFFLASEYSLVNNINIELQQKPNHCVLHSLYINSLFTFRVLSPPPHSSFNNSYPVTMPYEYSLFFANCGLENRVTMEVSWSLANFL